MRRRGYNVNDLKTNTRQVKSYFDSNSDYLGDDDFKNAKYGRCINGDKTKLFDCLKQNGNICDLLVNDANCYIEFSIRINLSIFKSKCCLHTYAA